MAAPQEFQEIKKWDLNPCFVAFAMQRIRHPQCRNPRFTIAYDMVVIAVLLGRYPAMSTEPLERTMASCLPLLRSFADWTLIGVY